MTRRVEAVYKGSDTAVSSWLRDVRRRYHGNDPNESGRRGEQRGYDPNAIAFVEVSTRAELHPGGSGPSAESTACIAFPVYVVFRREYEDVALLKEA